MKPGTVPWDEAALNTRWRALGGLGPFTPEERQLAMDAMIYYEQRLQEAQDEIDVADNARRRKRGRP
jgi:hypothetical protein